MKWKLLKAELEKELEFEHNEFDDDAIIGSFIVNTTTDSDIVSEEIIGQIHKPHLFTVIVHDNEGMIPHFHVCDAEGRHRKKRGAKKNRAGIHTCIEIRENRYFKHGAYQDNLDSKVLKQLDKFMSEVRDEPKYLSDIGMTNYEHTIRIWNQENQTIGHPNFVDMNSTKPDYTTVLG